MKEDVVKKTIENYERNSELYFRLNGSNISETIEVMDLLISHMKGKKLIDIGCGPGRDAKYLSESGLEVIGIDLSEKLLEIARKNSPNAKFLNRDMRKTGLNDNSFDGIFCRASLLHIPKDEAKKTLIELRRILKEDGILYIGVKKGSGEKFVEMNPGDIRFYSFYSEEEFKKLLESSELSIFKYYVTKTKTDEWINVFCMK